MERQISRVPMGRFWSNFDVKISTSNFLSAGKNPIILSCFKKKPELYKDNYLPSVFRKSLFFSKKWQKSIFLKKGYTDFFLNFFIVFSKVQSNISNNKSHSTRKRNLKVDLEGCEIKKQCRDRCSMLLDNFQKKYRDLRKVKIIVSFGYRFDKQRGVSANSNGWQKRSILGVVA